MEDERAARISWGKVNIDNDMREVTNTLTRVWGNKSKTCWSRQSSAARLGGGGVPPDRSVPEGFDFEGVCWGCE